MKQFLLFTTLFLFTLTTQAQIRSDFEGMLTAPDTFLNGSDGAEFYSNGPAIFPTTFSGGFWLGGWAISNVTDTVTLDFNNLYGAKTAMGHESETFAVGQQNAKIHLTPDLAGNTIEGMYLTNTTYAHATIRDGNGFAKPFGGTSGDDPDFFKLNIQGYKDGALTSDSVEFYLADFRFEDNTQDYIVDTWEWVDLTGLGPVDSLLFVLSSTDIGNYGINTPTFFCMDNLTVDVVSVFDTPKPLTQVDVFPNPANEILNIDLQSFDNEDIKLEIFNLNGQLIQVFEKGNNEVTTIDIAKLNTGSYLLKVSSEKEIAVKRFVKL